jgi:hypothetical protein
MAIPSPVGGMASSILARSNSRSHARNEKDSTGNEPEES